MTKEESIVENPVQTATIEKELVLQEKSMLQYLQSRPKKKIFIPVDRANPGDKVVPIGINGVIYSIPRGKEFEVPDLIYDVWQYSYSNTQRAEDRMTITENRDIVVSG